ncbi:hypothetical protein K466DRAFT_578390 [Polyporus arcularius HHB13444]|uniref:CxC2-like cysteine cluster KDZ transposase-associated domain-containing protein n=1 Tax=Polyporus arcularius HHB13444 TaxID=1314778 RepID=A0A5C3NZC0_9APHY|nr:hypothetical protein K466DRAFT_578390 [Polyporus arcularius HHB13444]
MWKERFPSIVQDMLSWEAAPYRCVECDCSAPRCKTCMCDAHQHAWFHYIEAWTGEYFKRYDLVSLGLVIHLGHRGQRCPHLSDHTEPSNMVVVHTNGVHNCRIHYCHCPDYPDHVSQLLRARVWPHTLDSPHTTFTVALLRAWHQLWLNAKISGLHFMRAIARYTDNAFPADVKDRTREFRLVSRVFGHLTMAKRAGKYHKLVVPNRDPNDLCTPCFQCSSPGFNVPLNWKEDTPDRLDYIFARTYAGDGNMSLNKRMRKDDKNDKPLSAMGGMWVNDPRMEAMINKSYNGDPNRSDSNQENETCSGFKVGRSQRTGKFRFVEVSGIVAITCRHVFFKSGAVIDLITGERFYFTDFALAGALRGLVFLPKELEKAYRIQEQTTQQFANLVALSGAKTSMKWASMDINTTAPTPSNWKEKVAAYAAGKNIYVLHHAESAYFAG